MLAVKPGDRDISFVEVGRQKQGVVGALLKTDHDLAVGDRHLGGIDQIAKDLPALGPLVAVADAAPRCCFRKRLTYLTVTGNGLAKLRVGLGERSVRGVLAWQWSQMAP